MLCYRNHLFSLKMWWFPLLHNLRSSARLNIAATLEQIQGGWTRLLRVSQTFDCTTAQAQAAESATLFVFNSMAGLEKVRDWRLEVSPSTPISVQLI